MISFLYLLFALIILRIYGDVGGFIGYTIAYSLYGILFGIIIGDRTYSLMLSVACPLAQLFSVALTAALMATFAPASVPIETKYGVTLADSGPLAFDLTLVATQRALDWVFHGGLMGIIVYLIYILRKDKN